MGPKTTVIESSTRQLLDLQIEGLPRLHEYYVFEAAGYDPINDTLLRQVVQHRKREKQPANDFGLWLIDLKNGQARKSRSLLPGKRGSGQGLQIVFDNLNRELVLMRTDGAYIYDRVNDDWQKVMDGDCSMLVFDYDPQHNVFLGLKPIGRFMAFRLKNVPRGTQAFYGWPDQK
jgi:hypothetical protein